MTDTTTERGRGEIEDLLPWYANGRISPADRAAVEAALSRDPELARRLELVREEMGETIAANEALPAPSSRAFDKLMAGIDAAPRATPMVARLRAGLIDRFAAFLDALAPRRLAYGALAVAALLVIQAAALTGLVGNRAGESYQTASHGTVVETGGTLLVAFAPQATMTDVAALLKRHGATLSAGPRANGFFEIRVPAATDAEALRLAADRLRSDTALVSFVQSKP